MIERLQIFIRQEPALAAHAAYWAAAILTLGGAWYLQIVGGLYPCPLCLEQREPWYAGITISAIVLALPIFAPGSEYWRARGLIPMGGLTLWGMYKAGEHIGVEHGWWGAGCVGPEGGAGPVSIEDLLSGVETETAVPCDAIQWEFLGLTLAGYNLIIQALLLAALIYFFLKARANG